MLRITGGEFRGRMLHSPPSLKTRPTQARLRQALFNSIQARLPDARVLDLFCGAGTLGYEALSRGASRVVFVEEDRTAVRLIEKNAAELKVQDRVLIVNDSVERIWRRIQSEAPFDIVLADPPYAAGWEKRLLEELPWGELLAAGGCFCLEWGRLKSKDFHEGELPSQSGVLVKSREKIYGDSVLSTYQKEGAS